MYKGRPCVDRKTPKNNAWTKEELLAECQTNGVNYKKSMTKQELCDLLMVKSPAKTKVKPKPKAKPSPKPVPKKPSPKKPSPKPKPVVKRASSKGKEESSVREIKGLEQLCLLTKAKLMEICKEEGLECKSSMRKDQICNLIYDARFKELAESEADESGDENTSEEPEELPLALPKVVGTSSNVNSSADEEYATTDEDSSEIDEDATEEYIPKPKAKPKPKTPPVPIEIDEDATEEYIPKPKAKPKVKTPKVKTPPPPPQEEIDEDATEEYIPKPKPKKAQPKSSIQCSNEVDPITQEEIPNEYKFTLAIADEIYCYDIRALYDWIINYTDEEDNHPTNPATGLPFSPEELDLIEVAGASLYI